MHYIKTVIIEMRLNFVSELVLEFLKIVDKNQFVCKYKDMHFL